MTEAQIEPEDGMRLVRKDGAEVRIDMVRDGWVFFASWTPGQEHGRLLCMPVETFQAACMAEGMQPKEGGE